MTTYTVRRPVDFIALSPVMLGFYPSRSVVMLTLGQFCARIDVPPFNEVGVMIDALLSPAKRHNVRQAAFVVFDEGDNSDILRALRNAFQEAGIEVVAALEVEGNQFRSFDSATWETFDLASHPFTLDSHLAGKPPFRTREELWELVRPRGEGWSDDVANVVQSIKDDGLMQTILGLHRIDARGQQLTTWQAALRGAEESTEDAQSIALVLAYAFWLAGDGAGAWTALDAADSSSDFHRVLTNVLTEAISPATWPTD